LAEMERFKGMALVVVTDSALHVFERSGRHFYTAWERVSKVDMTQAKFGRLLRIGSVAMQLEILYLTDAQIQTIRGLAARHAGALLGVGKKAGPGEGERPTATAADAPTSATAEIARRFTIPEFEASLGAVGAGADRPLGAAIDRLQMSSFLPVGFLEEHLRELRGIYDSALVKAKREAAAATDVFAAAAALNGRRLWEEVLESVAVATDTTVRAFERQTRRLAANRRIPWRKARGKFMPTAKEATGLRQRLTRGVSGLQQSLRGVSQAAEKLGPAAEADRSELKAAYDGWQESLRDLDRAYAAGWAGLSREVVNMWQDTFLPKLTRLGGERRRFLPRPVKVGLYFVLGAVAVIFLYLLATGQLGGVIQVE
ncbi:MAG: hypothetical protein JSU87_04690, partial [Gemmatimonadota bacterium]